MSVLYMIRHAQASFGKPDYDWLSDLGKRQAPILANHLMQVGLKFDSIYTGMQLRHEQTLAAYTDGCAKAGHSIASVKKSDAFNEYDSEKILTAIIPVLIKENPAFEADVAGMIQNNRSFQKVFEKVMSRWVNDPGSFDDLDTWHTYSGRILSAIDEMMIQEGAGKNVMVFTSGGPIAVTVQKALNLSNEDTLKMLWQIVNTSITRFKFSGNRLALFSFNDFSHLELERNNGLITYR